MKKNRIKFCDWFKDFAYDMHDYYVNYPIMQVIKDTNKLPMCAIYNYINAQGLTTVYDDLYSFLGQGTDGDDFRKKLMDYDLVSNNWNKYLSPVFVSTMYTLGGEQTIPYDTQLEILARIILSKFGLKWEKIIEAFNATYNPIHNYNLSETEKQSTDITYTDHNTVNTYGFNSTTASPVNKTDYSRDIDGDLDKNVRTLEKNGNIGVTTNQQMVTDELRLRDEHNIWNTILNDVCSVLFLTVY